MKILILGGSGMLGHQLLGCLQPCHEVKVTLRQHLGYYSAHRMFHEGNSFGSVDVRSFERVQHIVREFGPDVVINAIGIVKQRASAKEIIPSLEINALLPHLLAQLCLAVDARLIHFSTDCVFSGRKGSYVESDPSDAEDIYGRTKYLGEVHEENCLTLRTSIIGRELSNHGSLLDWFLEQTGEIKGFRGAIYTGFTTLEMSRIVQRLITDYPKASGVYHVSSEPISKYELLLLIREAFGHRVNIVPDDEFHCDRSLDSSRFREEFSYFPPTWSEMMRETGACA